MDRRDGYGERGGAAAAMRSVALYLGLAASVPASAFVGYAVGYGLDHWWGTRPVFEMILAGLGFAGGIVEVVRRMPRD